MKQITTKARHFFLNYLETGDTTPILLRLLREKCFVKVYKYILERFLIDYYK